jgi:aspartate carbamoyltransferase catalytic subunit
MLNLKNKNILSISDLSKQEIIHILTVANQIKKHPKPSLLNNYIMGSCFFEPSTRTRLSFETAMLRLGGQVIGFSESGITSVKKGETLSDAIKVIGDYVDVIVIRHSLEGAVRHGAEATNVPVINGGDGANQHPTQTLLDLFTIKECQKKLNGLKVALVGDLKYGRTVHSLTQALMHFNPRFHFIAPPFLQMPDYLKSELKKKKIIFSLHDKIEEIVNDVDILYMTRIQKERFADPLEYEQMKSIFVLTADSLSGVKNNLRIMHPLPRVDEIAKDVDKTKYAYYFQQAKNGVYVRQALLGLVLGKLH